MKNSKSILDKIIFVFIIIFLLSATNSIFASQIGYFGALILILIKYFVTKENPFPKTGLEYFFLAFLIIEFISAIFSIDKAQSFEFLLKRVLFIPVAYVIASGNPDIKKLKTYFYVYITAAIITMIFYIGFALEHFLNHLYSLQSKGPSPFQYVMTAGGIISFTTIILFAFFINEKGKLYNKILLGLALIISFSALAASYTRAAWLGAAAGLFTVLLLKRKWIVIIPALSLLIYFLLTAKNESEVYVFSLKEEFKKINSFQTEGRAYHLSSIDNSIFISDFEEGILQLTNDEKIKYETPSPAIAFSKLNNDYFLAYLGEFRLQLYKYENEKIIHIKDFATKGRVIDFALLNNNLILLDKDSGFTVYNKFPEIVSPKHIPLNVLTKSFVVDSNYIAISYVDKGIVIYKHNNFSSLEKIYTIPFDTDIERLYLKNNILLHSSSDRFTFYELRNDSVVELSKNSDIKNIFSFYEINDKIFAMTITGELFVINLEELNINKFGIIGFSSSSFLIKGDSLLVTKVKTNRFASLIDPYHPSNVERINQWRVGWKILIDNPFFGLGDVDMHKTYAKYRQYYEKETYGHLHNIYIHMAACTGFIGISVILLMLFMVLKKHYAIWKQVKEIPFASSFALGATGTFVAFLVSGLGEFNFGDQEIITLIWFIFGMNFAIYNAVIKKND